MLIHSILSNLIFNLCHHSLSTQTNSCPQFHYNLLLVNNNFNLLNSNIIFFYYYYLSNLYKISNHIIPFQILYFHHIQSVNNSPSIFLLKNLLLNNTVVVGVDISFSISKLILHWLKLIHTHILILQTFQVYQNYQFMYSFISRSKINFLFRFFFV